MKKIVALIVALMLVCSAAAMAAGTDIAILVPNADHGWTGAVLTYAEEKAEAINAEGKYAAKVISSADPANQIAQVEDIIENESAKSIVILPQDNTLEATMKKLADSGIPFVMFDRVIDTVSEQAVASVKGDNEGIGAETAKRFIASGMVPGDKILIMPGDNSSVSAFCWRTAGPRSRSKPSNPPLTPDGAAAKARSSSPSGWTAAPSKRLPSTSGSSPTTTKSPWAFWKR